MTTCPQPDPPFVPRDLWRMPGPLGPAMPDPRVRTLFLHHSVTSVTDDPCADARRAAAVGVERFGRCSYSYFIHPAGVVLEAQASHIGAHTAGWNSKAKSVCLLGNYDTTIPSDDMIRSACWLVWVLRGFGGTVQAPAMMPHRAVAQTACPGRHAVERVLPFMQAVAADPAWKPPGR